MTTLLLATTSKDKLKEIKEYLSNLSYTIISLSDINESFEVPETGKTIEENSRIKALFWGKKTGYLTLSDDSGLEIDALDGEPGVYSARYDVTPEKRIEKVLLKMKDIENEKRTARFMTVITLYNPGAEKISTFQGISEGRILREKRGNEGFGYDPIFYDPILQKTYAELSLLEKNKVSHRGKALAKVREELNRRLVTRN